MLSRNRHVIGISVQRHVGYVLLVALDLGPRPVAGSRHGVVTLAKIIVRGKTLRLYAR